MLRFLVWVALVVMVLYVGATVGFPYYQYVMMKWAVEEAADVGVAKLEAMRKGPWGGRARSEEATTAVTILMQDRAIWLGLDLPARAVQVSLEPSLFRVFADWETEARLLGYTQRFRFRVEGRRILAY